MSTSTPPPKLFLKVHPDINTLTLLRLKVLAIANFEKWYLYSFVKTLEIPFLNISHHSTIGGTNVKISLNWMIWRDISRLSLVSLSLPLSKFSHQSETSDLAPLGLWGVHHLCLVSTDRAQNCPPPPLLPHFSPPVPHSHRLLAKIWSFSERRQMRWLCATFHFTATDLWLLNFHRGASSDKVAAAKKYQAILGGRVRQEGAPGSACTALLE